MLFCSDMRVKRVDIFLAEFRKIYSAARDCSDPDVFVNSKRARNNILAVKFRADYSCAYRVAVKSHQQVEQRRAVADLYRHAAAHAAHYLLGKVERIVAALLERQERVLLKLLRSYFPFLRERVFRTDENVRLRGE